MNTKEILEYWFQNTTSDTTNAFWFDKSHDNLIIEKYKLHVDSITIDNYIDCIKEKNDKIALLIIGDQFTRNIYRNISDRTKNDNWALKLALSMIDMNEDLGYQLNYRYFILLPLRHAKSSNLLDVVRNRLSLYTSDYTIIPQSLIKFYNNTIKNYAELNDMIRVGEKVEYNDEFEKILEKYDRKESNKLDKVYETCKKYKNIALSLSGGVDSMVLFNALKYNEINFIAIHIEYCNRKEAKLERKFLEYYCYINNIKLYYRTIDYIVRDNDRNLFEVETRKARFNLYKYVVDRDKLEGVMLGHHSGDIVENVFTNIIKGRSLNDITVMEEMQEHNGILIMRPFLKLKKDDIIQIAQYNNIPYFLNSTPSWSCRGVLRDTIIPILKKQFGDFENNIIKFTESCSNYTKFYDENINHKIKETIMSYGSKIEYNKDIISSEIVENILLNTMHRNGYHMVSHKLKKNFIDWLNGNKINQIDLGKNMFCYNRNNYLYFINYMKINNEKPLKDKLLKDFDNYLAPKIRNIY
jgi:tRNA(Ile)-lysidine synthetase-like protein